MQQHRAAQPGERKTSDGLKLEDYESMLDEEAELKLLKMNVPRRLSYAESESRDVAMTQN